MLQKYRYGDFKRIDFAEFNSALKSSWSRRMIFSDTKRLNLFETELQTKIKTYGLSLKGKDFTSNICKHTKHFVPDNYASAKVAFLHTLKMQFRKNLYIPNANPLSKEYTSSFVFSVFHLTGKILTFKN